MFNERKKSSWQANYSHLIGEKNISFAREDVEVTSKFVIINEI